MHKLQCDKLCSITDESVRVYFFIAREIIYAEVIKMKNNSFAHGQELPLGLSMALAQVPAAYAYFAKLDPLQRQQIIDLLFYDHPAIRDASFFTIRDSNRA